MGDTFRSLENANYRLYASGAAITNVGTWIQRIAQDWLVLQLTGNSGAAVGITTGLQFLPLLICGPLAGVLADRYPKRSILIVTQLAQATVGMLLAVLTLTGVVQVAHIYALALALGFAAAMDIPARQAFVSEIVDAGDVPNAVALNSASYNAARVVGPGLAGVLIAMAGIGWVMLLNTLSYGAMIAALLRMNASELHLASAAAREPGMVRAALRYLWSRPDLQLLLWVVFFVGCFGLQFQITSALMATRVYMKGVGEFGLLGSVMALGSLAGSLHAARTRAPTTRRVVAAALAFGASEMIAGLMPTYLTFALVSPLIGFAAMTMLTSANTVLQLGVAREMRGRVMALYAMVLMGSAPIGSPTIGWIGDRFGPRWSLLAGGIASIVGTATAAVVFSRASSSAAPHAVGTPHAQVTSGGNLDKQHRSKHR